MILKLRKKQIISIIVFILLLVAIPAGMYLSQRTQIFKPKAAVISPLASLTAGVISSKDYYNSVRGTDRESEALNTLRIQLQSRKREYIRQLLTNPRLALLDQSLLNTRDSFPSEVQPYIESRVNLRGEFTSLYTDAFQLNIDQRKYQLMAADKTFNLIFTRKPAQVDNYYGSVDASGITLDKYLVVDTAAGGNYVFSKRAEPQTSLNKSAARGEQKIGVLLINTSEDPSTPFTKQDVEGKFFNDRDSLKNFINENSVGRAEIKGDVYDWMTVDAQSIYRGEVECDIIEDRYYKGWDMIEDWIKKSYDLAVDRQINLEQYNRIVYVFNRRPEVCGSPYGALGQATQFPYSIDFSKGDPSVPVKTIMLIYGSGGLHPNTLFHEFGHNLGLSHAGVLKGNTQNNCITDFLFIRFDEAKGRCVGIYDDISTVMGSVNNGRPFYNSANVYGLGWVGALEAQPGDNTYHIGAIERFTNEGKVLLIPKADTNEYYYIDFRDNYASRNFQEPFEPPAGRGVYIRIWDGSFETETVTIPFSSRNLPFLAGDSYYDPINNIGIEVTSIDFTAPPRAGIRVIRGTSAQPVSQLTRVWANYNPLSRGGQIIWEQGSGNSQEILFDKPTLCADQTPVYTTVGLEYSDQNGAIQTKDLRIRLKKSNALCQTGGSGGVEFPAPTGITASCVSPTRVRFHLTGGTRGYLVRLDKASDPWNAANCHSAQNTYNGSNDGCFSTLGNEYEEFTVESGVTYNWWVHARRLRQGSNEIEDSFATPAQTINCHPDFYITGAGSPIPAALPSPSPDPRAPGNLQASCSGDNVNLSWTAPVNADSNQEYEIHYNGHVYTTTGLSYILPLDDSSRLNILIGVTPLDTNYFVNTTISCPVRNLTAILVNGQNIDLSGSPASLTLPGANNIARDIDVPVIITINGNNINKVIRMHYTPTLYTISGNIFRDDNRDGIKQNAEPLWTDASYPVMLKLHPRAGRADDLTTVLETQNPRNGNYNFTQTPGNYSIEVSMGGVNVDTYTLPSQEVISLGQNHTYDIALKPPPQAPSGTIRVTPASCNIAEGQTSCEVTVTWSSSNATSIKVLQGTVEIGKDAALSGSQRVSISENTTFSLVNGSNNAVLGSTQVTVQQASQVRVSCNITPGTSVQETSEVTWTANISGGSGTYDYLWQVEDTSFELGPLGNRVNPMSGRYHTSGTKPAMQLTVSKGLFSQTILCNPVIVNANLFGRSSPPASPAPHRILSIEINNQSLDLDGIYPLNVVIADSRKQDGDIYLPIFIMKADGVVDRKVIKFIYRSAMQ